MTTDNMTDAEIAHAARFVVTPEYVKTLRSIVRIPSKDVYGRSLIVRRDPKGEFSIEAYVDHRVPEGSTSTGHSDRFPFPAHGSVEAYKDSDVSGCRLVASDRHYDVCVQRRASVLLSLANILKAGDQLHVHFTLGNTSEVLTAVGYTRDEAYVTVFRKNKAIATFTVDTYVGLNNSARMIARY